jgi:peptidyl-prolyl cis-trans isomerase B (cyclophilin B)
MDHKEGNPSIENEANNGLKNDKYTIAMARTSAPHSATSQFFINTNDNDFLNHTSKTLDGWGYCVFGKVVKGQEVVDEIEKVETTRVGMYRDVPSENIIITNVTVE